MIEIPTAFAALRVGSESSAGSFFPGVVLWVFILGYMPFAGEVERIAVFEESIAPEGNVVVEVLGKVLAIENVIADTVFGRKFRREEARSRGGSNAGKGSRRW